MTGVQESIIVAPDVWAHAYATAEHLPLAFKPVDTFLNIFDYYRSTAGLYSTGESIAWTVDAETFRSLLRFQLADLLPQTQLPEIAPAWPVSGELFPNRQGSNDVLLERIRNRRRRIQRRRGILSDSSILIRDDRER